MFIVVKTNRSNYSYDVRYNNGRVYARCQHETDANKVADALNAMRAQS